jgi:hypothetical protein
MHYCDFLLFDLLACAAVVFLPEHTADFGGHGSDKCYCVEMYGERKPWGCRW